MLIANNNEAERSRLWRIVMTVSSIVIILIAIFFLVRMFTSNPLEGTWKSEDNDLVLEINGKDSLTANIPEVGEAGNVQVELDVPLTKKKRQLLSGQMQRNLPGRQRHPEEHIRKKIFRML